MNTYVDAHTHLTHTAFRQDLDPVIQRALASGLGAIVVNGLEPQSNREILQMAQTYPEIKPALGIYPVDAVCELLKPDSLPFAVEVFSVAEELAFIREQAQAGKIAAIGECGLDGHWLPEATYAAQEKVFAELIEISLSCDLPLIVHSRKREERVIAMLESYQAQRVVMHCFAGRSKWALAAAEKHGWGFSIPANARKNQAFTKLLQELPVSSLLTETDAPYLAPVKGARNEPANVVTTVQYLADLRSWDLETAKEKIWNNYLRLFS